MGEALNSKLDHLVENYEIPSSEGIVNGRMDVVDPMLLQERELSRRELWSVVRDEFRWIPANCLTCNLKTISSHWMT